MTKILLTCLILCDAAPVTKVYVQTTKEAFKEDVALLKRGWYNHVTGGRCKALKIRYETRTKNSSALCAGLDKE